jgi:hypothetical protein
MTIPPHNLQIALHALVMIQTHPNHFSKHKQWAADALMALDPDLALLPPLIAMERVREGLTEETL